MFPLAAYTKLLLLLSCVVISMSMECEKDKTWGGKEYFSCPRSCCGPKWAQYCCDFEDMDEYSVFRFLGVVVGCIFVFGLIGLACCCCCCPCCWLAKRRTRGTIHGPSSAPLNPPVQQPKTQTVYTMQPPPQNQPYPPQNQPYPPQNQPYPTQTQPYPPQTQPYPTQNQPAYPPQQGYSQQPPQQGYGYPPQNPGYPPEQPPPYPGPPQSQPAFNPNAP